MYKNIYRKDYTNEICPECKEYGAEVDAIDRLYCCFCGCILGYNIWAVNYGLTSDLKKNKKWYW